MSGGIALLIPVYNNQDGLERSLASLSDEVPLDIVVDDGSSPLIRLPEVLTPHRAFLLRLEENNRLWKFPEYLLLGSGEGANERWSERTSFTGEIHSTLAGLAFYYGLPGVVMFFGFLYNLWRRIPYIWMRLLLIAPFIYSLSTYNLRNSMFWVGMGIFWIIADALRGRQKSQSERE